MMMMSSNIKIASFNVNGIRSSLPVLQELCLQADVIFLQEMLIMPHDCDILNHIHPDFSGFCKSGVNVEEGVVRGRPKGGIGVLWRKTFAPYLQVEPFASLDFTVGLHLTTDSGSTAILGVYLPVDYGSQECLADFTDCLTTLEAIIEGFGPETDILCIGDFNASYKVDNDHSRFFKELQDTCDNLNLTTLDTVLLKKENFTFLSAAHGSTSWLDHIVVSERLVGAVRDVWVNYDLALYDHMPLLCSLPFSAVCKAGVDTHRDLDATTVNINKWLWEEATETQKCRFAQHAEDLLMSWVRSAGDSNILYEGIVTSLKNAADLWIPKSSQRDRFNPLPNWGEVVGETRDVARRAYKVWRREGKPKDGPLMIEMKATRTRFRAALRLCRFRATEEASSRFAEALLSKNSEAFWKEVRKSSNPTELPAVIEGVTGKQEIADVWRRHFEKLFNHEILQADLPEITVNTEVGVEWVTPSEVERAIGKLDRGKAAGPDGVTAELLKHGPKVLHEVLAALFNEILASGIMPTGMTDSFLIPVPKDKRDKRVQGFRSHSFDAHSPAVRE